MRTDEIKSRLDAATPGEWSVETAGNTVKSLHVVSHVNGVLNHPICSSISPKTGDADLIANAPSDLAYLLAECDRKDAEIERLRNTQLALESDKINAEMNLKHLTDQVTELKSRIAESDNLLADHAEECAVLRKALEMMGNGFAAQLTMNAEQKKVCAQKQIELYIQQAREAIEHGKN